jgi:aldose 1-epimerase
MTFQPSITSAPFGELSDGRRATLYTLVNAHGVTAKITDFGAIITELHTPDRNGALADIVLGYDTVAAYERDTQYLGALIGRYGNRLRHGRFVLGGRRVQLPCNHGAHHLHGGPAGFHKVLWKARPFQGDGVVGLALHYASPDGDQGYPGRLDTRVLYQLGDDNRLEMHLHAVTDQATPVNLTQHTYFNLAGGGDILGHVLRLDADAYTPVDASLIPTGALAPVAGTPFDFRAPCAIGERIGVAHRQLQHGGGYDHNFVLNPGAGGPAARVVDPASGRVLELCTDEPGIQFYSGNFLDGTLSGKGRTLAYRSGFCLEPQHFPDSPNLPAFPNTILVPGEEYTSVSSFTFSAA